MNVPVEGDGRVRVPQKFAYRLDVYAAFEKPRCERVAKRVEAVMLYPEPFQKVAERRLIRAGVYLFAETVADHIPRTEFFERFQYRDELVRKRDYADGRNGFRSAFDCDKFVIDGALAHGAVHFYYPRVEVHVLPPHRDQFAEPKPPVYMLISIP